MLSLRTVNEMQIPFNFRLLSQYQKIWISHIFQYGKTREFPDI